MFKRKSTRRQDKLPTEVRISKVRPHREETRAKNMESHLQEEIPLAQSDFNQSKIAEIQGRFQGGCVSFSRGPPFVEKKWKRVHFRGDAPSSGPNFHPRRNPTQSVSPRSKATTLLPLQRRFGKKKTSGRGPIRKCLYYRFMGRYCHVVITLSNTCSLWIRCPFHLSVILCLRSIP